MTTHLPNPTHVRPPRRRWGSYRLPLEQRAVAAANLVERNGWPVQRAAAALCVNKHYVAVARHLGADERLKLSRGELRLSELYKDYCRRLAERRLQRLEAEYEAKIQAEREAQTRAVDGVLETVGLDRVVDAIVTRCGPRRLLAELEYALRRRDQDLGALIVSICDPGMMMAALDRATAPPRVTSNGGNGAQA